MEARQDLISGINPSEVRKARKASIDSAETTLEMIGREWLAEMRLNWAKSNYDLVARRLERDIFSFIGDRPIAEVGPRDLLVPLRRIADRGARETAIRVRQSVGQLFRYAVATERADRDVTPDLKGALPAPIRRNYPTITDPEEIGGLLRAI